MSVTNANMRGTGLDVLALSFLKVKMKKDYLNSGKVAYLRDLHFKNFARVIESPVWILLYFDELNKIGQSP